MGLNLNTQENQSNDNSGSNVRQFQKSDRAVNLHVPMQNEDGTITNTKLGVMWLKLTDSDHKDLIEWLDQDPANLGVLFQEMAKVSTYVDVTKKADRKPAFLAK